MSGASFVVLAAALFGVRSSFLWTGHVQDDAFIAFRTAFNLADHGELSFNLGERYAPSTSLTYAYFSALMRELAGSHAVLGILVANAVVASGAVVQLARLFGLSGARAGLFVVALGLSVGALLPSFNGMETAWCLLYVALLCEHVGPTSITPGAFAALLTLSSLVRPDALFFAASAWALRAFFGGAADRRRILCGGVGLGLGVLSCAGLNRLHSGTWLSPSILAKQAAYPSDFSLDAVVRRLCSVYLEGPLSLLPASKYVPHWLVVSASALLLAALGASLVRARSVLSRTDGPRFLFLAAVALVFPSLFALGGVLFSWYFYPASFALAACLLIAIERLTSGALRRALSWLSAGAAVAGCAVQFLVSFNIGRQESGYRASVGEYLATVAAPGDTLVLEPAGYIPYFSRLTTYDEVGLASPRVLPYLAAPGSHWLGEFLREVCPTFAVQRNQFPSPDAEGAALTPAESWFNESYRLIRTFVYRPQEWATSPLELRILKYGSHSDYLVYQRRDDAACPNH